MNKQELNNAFESFNPTDEQKQRMFANIMAQKSALAKKTPVKIWKKIYIPACSVAAAALMFAVISGSLVPKNITNDTYVVHNSDINGTDTTVVSEYEDNIPDELYVPQKDTAEKVVSSEGVKAVEKNKPEMSGNTNNTAEGFTAEKDTVVAEPEIIPGEVTAFAMNINTASASLRSRSVDAVAVSDGVISDDMAVPVEQISAAAGGGGAAAPADEEIITVTYEEFCSGLGIDVKSALVLPDDMVDLTDTERTLYGVECADEWDLVYQGNDNRILTVNISLDMEQNMQYFENDSFIKTDFNGTSGVVIYDGASYTSYINKSGVAYTVNTNITENELADLLLGITAD